MSDEDNYRLKDINEGISHNIVTNDVEIDNAYAKGDYAYSFSKAQMIFSKISMFEFDNKDSIVLMEDNLEQYFATLGGKPANEKDKIIIGQMGYDLKFLLKEYIKEIRCACYSLGLWLKVFRLNQDRDEQFSKETFGTHESLLEQKKAELVELSSEELLALLNPKFVHSIHSRMLINRGVK